MEALFRQLEHLENLNLKMEYLLLQVQFPMLGHLHIIYGRQLGLLCH